MTKDFIVSLISSQFFQAIVIAILTIWLTQVVAARGKLMWSVRHAHWYRLPSANQDGTELNIVTQELWFNNAGRAAVEDIEIVLNWTPQHYELWTPREFSQNVLPDGRLIIKVPFLSARDWFSISILDVTRLPEIVNVRSKNSKTRLIAMEPTRKFPDYVLWMFAVVLIMGLAAIIYFLISFGKILFEVSGSLQ
ncbi:hypothetical protein [Agrobacterium radiobacter]